MTQKYFSALVRAKRVWSVRTRVAAAFAAAVAAAVLGLNLAAPARVAHAANLYAQYADGVTRGSGSGSISPAYITGVSHASYVQVELNIMNDGQYGTNVFCPVAPNTGVLVFIFHQQNYVYVHCVTSAEAAGKLGRKAVYTFNGADFGFGDTDGWWMNFISLESFNAEVYGTVGANDVFYPYLVLADGGGPGSPATIGSLAQYDAAAYGAGATTTLPENGDADGNAVVFAGVPRSFFASDTVRFEAEVRPFGMPFVGAPSAAADPVLSGTTSSVTVSGLAPGAYHWAARSVDMTGGYASEWAEYRVAGNVDFRIPTSSARDAIVIVPGAMGSRLDRATDGSEVWPDAGDMISSPGDGYLDYLKLSASGAPSPSRPVAVPDILREATATFLGIPFSGVFYKNLIDTFLADGYVEGKDLFVAPYDWRLGAESSTASLAAKVALAASSSATGKVDIIAHSMGGLLVKQYLAGFASTTGAGVRIGKVVLLGVPQLGAPKAWKLLNYGDDLGLNWFGFGLNAKEMKAVAANMPSAYELLPSRRYVGIAGGYIQDFRSASRAASGSGGGAPLGYNATPVPNAGLAAAADAFHGGLDADGFDMRPVNASSVYNIVGCGEPTLAGFNLYDNGVVDVARAMGDGTVPEVSAMNRADGFHNYFVLGGATGVDHAGLVKDPAPLALVRSIIDDADPPAASAMPRGIGTSLAACFNDGSAVPVETGLTAANATTVEFSTHSPVTLDVYDGGGRHTGVTGADVIVTEIPGSSYETIGENSFVTLPPPAPGDAYRVVVAATATGTFELKVKQYGGGAEDELATYVAVPLGSASATAEMSFAGFGGGMRLDVDVNGDGMVDTTRLPDAVLSSPSSTADVTPPEITMPDIPAEVLEDSTATIAFGAADGGSGLASVSAMLNGAAVADGTVAAFTTPGRNTFTLTATDRAGNPRTGKIEFAVVPPPPPPATTTVALPAAESTYISRRHKNENYGSGFVLRIGGQEEDRALVRFDLAGLKDMLGTSTVTSAALVFGPGGSGAVRGGKSNGGAVPANTLYAFLAPAKWSEGGATWACPSDADVTNNKTDCAPTGAWPGQSPPQAVARGAAAADGDGMEFDVTADLVRILGGAGADYGFMVTMDGKNPVPLAEFASDETATPPLLVVTYEERR